MNKQAVVTIDGRQVVIENEQNLLELIRKADIDLVTFCYHSELSVYGACRLCFVEVEGRGFSPHVPPLRCRDEDSHSYGRTARDAAVTRTAAGES